MTKFLLSTLLVFFCYTNFAATITSFSSGNWSAGSTWVGGNAPTPTDDVVITSNHTVILNVDAIILSLKIGNTGAISTLTINANLTITSTTTALSFGGGTMLNDGILDCTNSTPRTIIINGNITLGSGAGTRGNINIDNAYHIFEVKGNITTATSTGINFLNGVCKFTGSTATSLDNGTSTTRFADVEIGDGINSKSFSFNAAATGAIRFADNKKLTVLNAATFNLKNKPINTPLPSGTNFNLIIKNGGAVYDYDALTAGTVDVLQYTSTINNGELTADVEQGDLNFYSDLKLNAARDITLPLGNYGNLYLGRIGTTSPSVLDPAVNLLVNGAGVRNIKIYGNLFAGKQPTVNTSSNSIYYNFIGSNTPSDRHNITLELAGLDKSFRYDQNGKVSFGSTNAAASSITDNDAEIITKISGRYIMFHYLYGVGNSTLNFFDLAIPTNGELKWGDGSRINSTTTSFPTVGLRGNLVVDGLLDVFNTRDNSKKIPANFGVAGVSFTTFGSCNWSGAGIVKCYSFALGLPGGVSNSFTNCSINDIQILGNNDPANGNPMTVFNGGNACTFKQTAGTFTFKNGGIVGNAGFRELTATSANVNWQFNNITVDAGVTVSSACNWSGSGSTGIIIGNLTVNGFWKMNQSATGSSPFVFKGTALQTIGGTTTSPIEFYDLQINNPSGVRLLKDIDIVRLSFSTSNRINFVNGVFYGAPSPNGLVSFDATGTTSNFLPSTTTSFVAGPVKKTGNASFVFPIGDTIGGNKVAPVSLTNLVAATNSYTAQYIRKGAKTLFGTNYTSSPSIHHVSDIDYWQVDKNSGTQADVGFYWTNSSSNNGATNYITNLATLGVAHFNGTSWDQMLATGSGMSMVSSGIITATNQTSFSPFALASINADNPLPNKACFLHGSIQGNINVLNCTAIYTLGSTFTLQKSTDGVNFSNIATLLFNNSLANFNDVLTTLNTIHYRVKITDLNNNNTYSNTILLQQNSSNGFTAQLYPTTVNTFTTLYINALNTSHATITILNSAAQQVFTKNIMLQLGNNNIALPFLKVTKGFYFVDVAFANGTKKTFTCIKQ